MANKLVLKSFYVPTNLKLELKSYLNGYIIWFSSFLCAFKKSNFLLPGVQLSHKNHKIHLCLSTAYLKFYSLNPQFLQKKETAILNAIYLENTQNFISALTGYRKILTIRGIGYKFNLKSHLLFLECGYSHTLSFYWKRAFNVYFSRKLKSMYLKTKNLKNLMDFLSNIKKKRPVNNYTRKGIHYSKEVLKYKDGKRKKSF